MTVLFGRKNEIVVNRRSFSNEFLYTTFNIPFDDGPEPNIGSAEIYNLSDNTINTIKNNDICYINAGYKDNVGAVIVGIIKNVTTRKNGVDKITSFDIIDSGDQWLKIPIKRSYKANTNAYVILDDLLKLTGLKVASFTLTTNKVYRSGKSFDGTLYDAILEVVRDCGDVFTVVKNVLYIKKKNDGVGTSLKIDFSNGLVGTPTKVEKEEVIGKDNDGKEIRKTVQGWKITTLLLHKVQTNTIIDIDSETAKGRYRVESGRHISNANKYYTEVEVYPL